MPLTPNGKVDRRALPVPELDRSTLGTDFKAPRNAIEETLANIWAQVIGLERVGINDNFFELGGDSILAIQITSKSNQIGIYLAPDQLFHYPTIAQLADIAGTEPNVQAEQGVVTGPMPLTPIQHWFFEQNLRDSHHWNQAFLLRAPHTLDFSLLEKAVYQLLIHHDALRLRFAFKNSEWHQTMTSLDDVVPVSRMDLTGLTNVEQKKAIESIATELQASLDLSKGPLIQVALFELGSQEFSCLLIIIHHLAVDGVSWRILLEHLEVLYNQLSHNQVTQLPSKTTSYKQWARQLTEYAQSDKLQEELPFWLATHSKGPAPLPVDYPRGIEDNTVSSADIISVSLNTEETEILLKQVPKVYHTQINDVLLTALSQAINQWTGASILLVDLEGHGREAIFKDIDLLRTVGWFTTIFPVSLSLESTSNPGEMLKSIKEQLRRIPNRGIGYGLLRYLRKDTETLKELMALPQAELSFNYLGQFDQILSPTSPFKLTNESYGPRRSLRGNRRHLLEISGSIVKGTLTLNWVFSKNIHHKKTIDSLAQGFMEVLRNLIDHCQSPTAGGFTPSDFPEVDLSQDELDDLMLEIGELEE
jgi:non-ribosomal peptide synthase protein (TIGR01720 family)